MQAKLGAALRHRTSWSCSTSRSRHAGHTTRPSISAPERAQLCTPCHATDPSRPPSSPSTAQPSTSSDPKYEYKDPLNQFFSNWLPRPRDVSAELSHIDWQAPKARGLTLEQMAQRLEVKLAESEWFVTGLVEPSLFSDNFSFADDTVATKGIKSYATGVRSLFDQETARAQLISVAPEPSSDAIIVNWRLEGRVNLPLRPTIPPYIVRTTFRVDQEGLICSHLDEFTVPGWQLLAGALLGPWAGPPPPPPIEQLRAEAAKSQRT